MGVAVSLLAVELQILLKYLAHLIDELSLLPPHTLLPQQLV